MVFYSKTALDDIENIFVGLLTWTTKDNFQPKMSFDEVWKYRNDVYNEGLSLDKLHFHFKTTFEAHKRFGQFVHRFDRNKRTQWYIIYNIDKENNILINKIINNYLTVS